MKKVALLVGGWSAEREVSLTKGKAVEQGLKDAGYEVSVIDVKRDLDDFVKHLKTARPDVVFNNLHGRGGEDGIIQGVLEMMDIPYTHSDVMASAICMNKPMAKRIAGTCGVPTAPAKIVPIESIAEEDPLSRPYVLKPACEGSSVGVYIIQNGDNRVAEMLADWDYGGDVMAETYIKGRELTVAVLDGKAQAVTEIIASNPFFDYEAKYKAQDTQYVLPADIPERIYNDAMGYAERIYTTIGCCGLARCDFRYDDSANGAGLVFLEINNQPGLTSGSIGPSQVIYNGKSFSQLCAHMVEQAYGQKETS